MTRSGRYTILLIILAGFIAAFGLEGLNLVVDITRGLNTYGFGILIGAIVGVILHELAHSRVAVACGCRAGFKYTLYGILITIGSGILQSLNFVGLPRAPIAFIAPGYVIVYCYTSYYRVHEADIAAAGPATNVLLAGVGYLLSHLNGINYFGYGFMMINAALAFFNLLPIPPLDGSKVIRRRPLLWIILMILSIAMMYKQFLPII